MRTEGRGLIGGRLEPPSVRWTPVQMCGMVAKTMLHGWCLVPSLACHSQTIDGVVPQAVLNVKDLAYLDAGRFQYWVHLYAIWSSWESCLLGLWIYEPGLATLLGIGRRCNSQHRFKPWHRSKERIARLSSESLGASPTLIGEFRDKSDPFGWVQGLGIEQPCWRLTQRQACGANFLWMQWRERASREPLLMAVQGLTCVGVCDDSPSGLGRAGAQCASTRVTTHTAPHTLKRQEHTTDTSARSAQLNTNTRRLTHSLTHERTCAL